MTPYYADDSVQRPKSARDFGYNGSALPERLREALASAPGAAPGGTRGRRITSALTAHHGRMTAEDADNLVTFQKVIRSGDRDAAGNAERQTLGAILHGDRWAIDAVTTRLTGADYYQPRHATIHDAAVHLYARGTTPEPAAITAHLAQLVHERDRLRAEVGA